jgi:hypothetical protein
MTLQQHFEEAIRRNLEGLRHGDGIAGRVVLVSPSNEIARFLQVPAHDVIMVLVMSPKELSDEIAEDVENALSKTMTVQVEVIQ